MEGSRGEWRGVEESGWGQSRVEGSRSKRKGSGGEWRVVEEGGGMWRRVEGGRGEWKAVEDRGCRINLMDTCEVCRDQLSLSSGVYRPHTPLSVYVHIDNRLSCP